MDPVWWRVRVAGAVLLIKAPSDVTADEVIGRALHSRGFRRVLQAQAPDGTWFTPAGPIPGDAIVRREWPDEWLAQSDARHATPEDMDLFNQEVVQ